MEDEDERPMNDRRYISAVEIPLANSLGPLLNK